MTTRIHCNYPCNYLSIKRLVFICTKIRIAGDCYIIAYANFSMLKASKSIAYANFSTPNKPSLCISNAVLVLAFFNVINKPN